MADLVFRHAGSSDGARIAIGPHAENRADQSVYRRTSPKHIACERRGPSPGRRHTPAMRRLSIGFTGTRASARSEHGREDHQKDPEAEDQPRGRGLRADTEGEARKELQQKGPEAA